MAKFKFVAGTEFDILTPEEYREEMDGLKDEVKKLRHGFDELWKRPTQRRWNASVTNTGAAAATGKSDVFGPSKGFEWSVRRIVVTGQDSSTVVAGATGAIFRQLPDSPLYIMDVISSVPWSETYGEGEFSVNSMEDLVVVIYNQPNSGNGSTIFISGESREAPQGYYFGSLGGRR